MEILYLLVPLSVVLVFIVGAVFWYALSSGQFDDLEGPAHSILMDDDSPAQPGASVPETGTPADRGKSVRS